MCDDKIDNRFLSTHYNLRNNFVQKVALTNRSNVTYRFRVKNFGDKGN